MWISFPYLMLLSVFAVWTSFSYHFSHCYKPYKSWIIEVPERERYYGDINEYEESQYGPR